MFSGIIQYRGAVIRGQKDRLIVNVPTFKAKLGDSVAINGICLTVTDSKTYKNKVMSLGFSVSEETRNLTTIKQLKQGDIVNIEPALKLSGALGGHIVQGHVDGTGRLEKIRRLAASKEFYFLAPKHILSWLVEKGSVTVDGVSLTVVKLTKKSFSVAVIPYTLANTTLGKRKVGDEVNLEADVIGKYVAKYLKK